MKLLISGEARSRHFWIYKYKLLSTNENAFNNYAVFYSSPAFLLFMHYSFLTWCLQRQLQPLPNHSKQLSLRGATRGSSTTPTALYPPPAATATTFPGDTSSQAGSPRGGAGAQQQYLHNAHSKSDHDHNNVFTSKSRSERHASSGGAGVQYNPDGAQLDRGRWVVGGPGGAGAKRSAVHIPTMDFRALRESNLWRLIILSV